MTLTNNPILLKGSDFKGIALYRITNTSNTNTSNTNTSNTNTSNTKEKIGKTLRKKFAGELYFTILDHLPNYYKNGGWVQPIILPDDAIVFSGGDKWITDKLVVGKRHYLTGKTDYLFGEDKSQKILALTDIPVLMKGSDFKGVTFYKITNSRENHYGFQYKKGLNTLRDEFREKGSCGEGGLYFTTLEYLHHFYDYGVWIRKITLPNNAKVIKDPDGGKWRADKVILGKRYYLFSMETIRKFDLMMTWQYGKYLHEHRGFFGQSKDTVVSKRGQLEDARDVLPKIGFCKTYFDNIGRGVYPARRISNIH